MKNIAIIGASGGIGAGFVRQLLQTHDDVRVYALSRSALAYDDDRVLPVSIDITNEGSVAAAANLIDTPLDMVIIATGLLHSENMMPEKSVRDIAADSFMRSYEVNTVGPALVGKYFLPLMRKGGRAVFAALSARVGSVSDNKVGGWYAYRASKAALNMVLKNFAIEMGRRHKELIIAALQPGTVDTKLSEPFQGNVAEGKLFTADFSASALLGVLDNLSPADSGQLFDWQGTLIEP